ncbi:unnamed protein product [Coffea canephora]|uniref:non-specific serine/threonine protein kinase n=1 Tax=Coffea canephora TaxID=49390 RepID=A0A068TLM2_COFCA|nr:unnamed protein product [Coffea canephora]
MFPHYKSIQTHKSCNFAGAIPNEIRNLTMLMILDFRSNILRGLGIPENIGNLHRLEVLVLYSNTLSGSIPTVIFNISSLQHIQLDQNKFSGTIPLTLVFLSLHHNELTGSIPTSLGSLRNLSYLNLDSNKLSMLDNNPLNGFLPASFSNYSTSLEVLSAISCKIEGNIPARISNLSSLLHLDFSSNELIGSLPRTMHSLANLQDLGLLSLSQNQIFGSIPECLGNMTNLRQIFLDSNRLTSMIPSNLLSMKDLEILNLSSNFISGSLSLEIGNLKATYDLDLSANQLAFHWQKNNLQGSIPESISNMISLEFLDLSHNNLFGVIPKSMEALKSLKECNVSFNRLSVRRSSKRKVLLLVISLSGIAAILIIAIGALLYLRWLNKPKTSGGTELMSAAKYERFSYYDLLHSTDNYNESNLLGEGSYGSVYKGILSDGTAVAIKVFNLLVEGSLKSFDRECEVLKSLCHQNLTKVLDSCSNLDFKALVLKYMPNGNLEKWLYSHNHFLDMFRRINIMIDVACALEYLHYGYDTPVVHCDLKPSNILLDEDMAAHVSDFGIAKMFGEEESILHTNTLATLGYIAPVANRVHYYYYFIYLDHYQETSSSSLIGQD